ncbi:hypothetical protein MJT46_005143 [Ovis ammon polii x Ovis aries]|nr:hypothetical protein MJT46_005143 [Ovis ammon polii x Ovis aries]
MVYRSLQHGPVGHTLLFNLPREKLGPGTNDPEGSEVDMIEENDYTGIISFPDFKIPSNPKYGVWTIRAKYKEDFSTTGTAYFEVKEYGGFSEEAEIPGIKYVLSPYKLNLVATPLFVKPGIPYSIKVQVKDSFDHLVGGIPVTLSARTFDVNQEISDLESKKSVTRSSDGVASFVVNLPSEVTVLEFNIKTEDLDLPEENQASKDYRAVAYSSLSQSYLYIDWTENDKHLLVGEHLSIVVTPRSPYIDKITHYNYLILSKGKIVHYGTRDKLSDSAYQSINIPVTQDMVPSARLLVYYIVTGEQTAELVSDSVWLNIEEKCGNQLEVFQTLETSDLGCGAGGGRDNADVFYLAGLTFLTNANADHTREDGICVANTLKAKVFKSVFLEMNIPYSVVRGEQIQLSGTVYNYRTSGIQFCVKMHPVEGICSSGSPGTDSQGRRFSKCVPQKIEGSSSHLVTFTVLPLEIGLHNLSFSLETSVGNEILVKTLRVVPEGVKRESYAGVTLDPQGIYGIISRRKEFPYRIPLNMVPKTKVKRTVSIKGLLIGEVMSAVLSEEGIDSLTHLPKGNAEAELMSAVPVFYVYHYLEAGHNWDIFSTNSLTQKQNLKTKLKEGMASIMSFRNADYSYSMWKGGGASTWLTAFALRVLGQISKYVDQNQNSICNSLLWLLEKCQLENGSFKENSDYQPVKLQGTLPVEARENTLYLTAFAVIGIRKAFDICPLEKISTAVSKADIFLHENALSTQSAFTLAIAAYALSLGDKSHPQFRSIVSALKKKAFVKGNPPIYRFWKDDLEQKDSSAPNTGTARMVETTAYALLTSLSLKDMNYDTINAIEGLTEYSLLGRKLRLNMDVKVSYKNKGDLYHYKMSDKYFLGRPIEVKTVVHKISTSEEVCSFHLKIETREIEEQAKNSLLFFLCVCLCYVPAFGYSSSEYKRIVACASYKFSSEESSSGSSHAVMDISLPTGVNANPEDLKALVEQVDQLLTDYEIKDGHVILQLNSIPSNEFLCVRFRIIELFEVGFLSPATFTVYEYHRPADCGQMQAELDLTISAATRKERACKPDIAYAYKVEIIAVTEENAFVKYTATLLDIYKAGEAAAERDAEITFIKKTTCSNANLEKRKQYLIMGKEALQIKYNFRIKYVYPLDSSTWIEYWPTGSTCPSCQRFLANLDEFTEDIFLNGCENA